MRFDLPGKKRRPPGKGGSKMFSRKMISWKKLALAVALAATLGLASCGVHVGGHIGSHHAGAGVGVDDRQ